MGIMNTWPSEPGNIKRYLCDLWGREYPEQGCLPLYYTWKHKSISISQIKYGNPFRISPDKVDAYVKLLCSGISLPPLVCLYGELIDGYHRYHAFKKFGLFTDSIDVYMNRE